MSLYLVHASTARIHANDVIVEAVQAALAFDNQLRLKRGLAGARDVEVQFAVGRNNRLGAAAVAVVTGFALLGCGVEVVAQSGG